MAVVLPPIIVPRLRNDYIPLDVGGVYNIGSTESGQWVEIVSIDEASTLVYVRGIDSHVGADWVLPAWHFDDIVSEYYGIGLTIIAPNWSVELVDEDGNLITGD